MSTSTSLSQCSPEEQAFFDRSVLMLQIIVGALVAGLVTFLAVTFVIRSQQRPNPPAGAEPTVTLPVLTVVAYTFTAIAVPLSLVLPAMFRDAAVKRVAAGKALPARSNEVAPAPAGDLGPLVQAFTTAKIVGAALNEGVAFLALVAWMIEGQLPALGLAVALVAGVAV